MPDKRKEKPAASDAFRQVTAFPAHIQQGIEIARREIPDLAPIEPYGWVSRKFTPANAAAYVSPGRTIYLNPEVMASMSPEDVADTILHEQTHVQQARDKGQTALGAVLSMMLPQAAYHLRPHEQDAWQAEIERRRRMGRPQTARPSFVTGNYYAPADITLPASGVKRGQR
jgi:hypothetical protein